VNVSKDGEDSNKRTHKNKMQRQCNVIIIIIIIIIIPLTKIKVDMKPEKQNIYIFNEYKWYFND
jgi:hypothetical protein